MRKILSLLLVLSIVVTSTVWEEPNVFAQELQMEEMSQEAFIEESNEFVEVSEEGLIELELPDDLLEQISEEEYAVYLEAIDSINELIEQGELKATENGTLYETSDDELVVQGGNVDKMVYHWWGYTRYANNKNTKKLINRFNTASNGAWVVCGGTASASYLFPVSAPYTGLVSGLTGMAAGYWGLLATRMSAKNKGKGVIVNMTWVLVFTVKSQK
ncbi:hypothetical protein [uncultured Eubacterium sp.]|uniref:hypothetical protein n=1 Tax=uncultured Eubacterium sp. TaxID=165185 RepID=UPI002671BD85|nr:hypothetical protein [uncultured Eubacterium sp.]